MSCACTVRGGQMRASRSQQMQATTHRRCVRASAGAFSPEQQSRRAPASSPATPPDAATTASSLWAQQLMHHAAALCAVEQATGPQPRPAAHAAAAAAPPHAPALALAVALLLLGAGADASHAAAASPAHASEAQQHLTALAPLADLAEDDGLLTNFLRTGRFFVTVMLGTGAIILRPLVEALKRPVSAVIAVAGVVGLYAFVKFTLDAMLGLSDPVAYDYY